MRRTEPSWHDKHFTAPDAHKPKKRGIGTHICGHVSYVVMLHETPLLYGIFMCDRPHKTGFCTRRKPKQVASQTTSILERRKCLGYAEPE